MQWPNVSHDKVLQGHVNKASSILGTIKAEVQAYPFPLKVLKSERVIVDNRCFASKISPPSKVSGIEKTTTIIEQQSPTRTRAPTYIPKTLFKPL
jgi:hypothetical protein